MVRLADSELCSRTHIHIHSPSAREIKLAESLQKVSPIMVRCIVNLEPGPGGEQSMTHLEPGASSHQHCRGLQHLALRSRPPRQLQGRKLDATRRRCSSSAAYQMLGADKASPGLSVTVGVSVGLFCLRGSATLLLEPHDCS
jgi:hypothetical protein